MLSNWPRRSLSSCSKASLIVPPRFTRKHTHVNAFPAPEIFAVPHRPRTRMTISARTMAVAARIDADLIDHAIAEALIDFYHRTDLIHDAVTAERQLRTADSGQHQAERKAIDAQITATETAIDRNLTAF